MYKIWVKTIVGEKLTRNILWKKEGAYRDEDFRDTVYEICTALDIPSPLLLPMHIRNFQEFNICRFRSEDFVEQVDFEAMTLEYCKEDKKPRDLRFYP